jgi:hypothetical protein
MTLDGSGQLQAPASLSPGKEDVHFAGLLDFQNILSADTGISRKNEGNSFGDHRISESVSVKPSSVIEVSIVLCSVFSDSRESMFNQPALNTRYFFITVKVFCCLSI